MRNEVFTPSRILKKKFKAFDDNSCTAGPVVYYENGRKYYDDGESHIKVVGRTGKGKSQVGSLPFVRNAIIAKESFIAVDSKAELYNKTACYAENTHNLLCIDFRNFRNSPVCWNPLYIIKELYNSSNPEDNDIACSMLGELSEAIQMNDKDDPFWGSAGAQLFRGIVCVLLEIAENDEININSVCRMLEHFNERTGTSTYDKKLYAELPENSIARRHLSTFCNSPQDTRNSIYAVCSNSLKPFSESVGLMNMLSQDSLHINELDSDEKPLAIYIIIPDEVNTYDALTGLLVSQLTQHFIRFAQDKYSGKLPNRLNIILEELGSIGRAIKNLPNLMTAARSRNIRLMLLLQSNSQLEDVYGKSNAETINASVGITIGFSTNDWSTLKEWEERCGERVIERHGMVMKEPLITAAQLAAMPICTALVTVDARYKYICHFPFYDQMYDNSDWRAPTKQHNTNFNNEIKTFNLKEYIHSIENEKRNELFGSHSNPFEQQNSSHSPSEISDSYTVDELDLDDMMKKIDERLAELENEDSEVDED